ncbi:uncharacterized protein LOC101855502 [Aplysia californica]|uniref:Uncharacterized protein LOC101855502 n=1 Tax=Aplysia californica TaxID=6500 RepID=A0ABM0JUR1_APLCA|nr:uncharacterized protein LOC101855502 [Aplysia californica]
MSRVTALAILLSVAAFAASNPAPQPCQFPSQFVTLETCMEYRRWANVFSDFTNKRKLLDFVDSDDFIYVDMDAQITKRKFGGVCLTYREKGYAINFDSIPASSVLETRAGSTVGEDVEVVVWKIDTPATEGEIAVTKDTCYPVYSSLVDKSTEKSLYLLYTDVQEEGFDASVFDNLDFSGCPDEPQ